jgi:anaerobic sulfite reductase subunit B
MGAEAAAVPGTLPTTYRVAERRRETPETWTLELDPAAGVPIEPLPGQFTMLYAFAVGEVPISMCGTGPGGRLVHSIRDVGAVTRALCQAPVGTAVGARGPFGNTWPVAADEPSDVVVVAGGCGMAPLRAVVERLASAAAGGGRRLLLHGARTPEHLMYRHLYAAWEALGMEVALTVDTRSAAWTGPVGVSADLVAAAAFDAPSARAFVCGPEAMMHSTARALLERGVRPDRIFVSLERAMKCGVGHCGNCQLGPTLICRDGPVYSWDVAGPLLAVAEL